VKEVQFVKLPGIGAILIVFDPNDPAAVEDVLLLRAASFARVDPGRRRNHKTSTASTDK
jgi:hypothetical protein